MAANPVAVVTGASAGVGRATARAFAEAGFDVALLARGGDGLEGAAKDVMAAGVRAVPIATDVSHFAEVDGAATLIENELGPIDVWVNDAMTTVFAPSWEMSPDDFQRAVEVTFLGQVWGTTAALARMRPRNRGNIVNVGSALAYIGIPLQSAYCSSKFRVPGLLRIRSSRATPREKQREVEHGPPSGGQHATVQLVCDDPGPPPSASSAHLSARGAGQIHPPGRLGRSPQQGCRNVEQSTCRRWFPVPWLGQPLCGAWSLGKPTDRPSAQEGQKSEPSGTRRR